MYESLGPGSALAMNFYMDFRPPKACGKGRDYRHPVRNLYHAVSSQTSLKEDREEPLIYTDSQYQALCRKLRRRLEDFIENNTWGMENFLDPCGKGYFSLEGFMSYQFATILLQEPDDSPYSVKGIWTPPDGADGEESYQLCVELFMASASLVGSLEKIRGRYGAGPVYHFCFEKEKTEGPRLYGCISRALNRVASSLAMAEYHRVIDEKQEYNIFNSLPEKNDETGLFTCLSRIFNIVMEGAITYCLLSHGSETAKSAMEEAYSGDNGAQEYSPDTAENSYDCGNISESFLEMKEKYDSLQNKMQHEEEAHRRDVAAIKNSYESQIAKMASDARKQGKEISKIRNTLKNLKAENKQMRVYISDLRAEENEADRDKQAAPAQRPCNTMLRYAFVCENKYPKTQAKILSHFPNSFFAYSSKELERASFDTAILFTKYCSHHLYYNAKTICDRHGIPYIHIAQPNVDRIESQIANSCRYREGI